MEPMRRSASGLPPGGPPCDDDDFLDAPVSDPPSEELAVDRIAVPDHVSRGLVVRKHFDELLRSPSRRWVSRHVEVDGRSLVVPEYNEKKYARRGSRNGKEADGHEIADMVVQKGSPGW